MRWRKLCICDWQSHNIRGGRISSKLSIERTPRRISHPSVDKRAWSIFVIWACVRKTPRNETILFWANITSAATNSRRWWTTVQTRWLPYGWSRTPIMSIATVNTCGELETSDWREWVSEAKSGLIDFSSRIFEVLTQRKREVNQWLEKTSRVKGIHSSDADYLPASSAQIYVHPNSRDLNTSRCCCAVVKLRTSAKRIVLLSSELLKPRIKQDSASKQSRNYEVTKE